MLNRLPVSIVLLSLLLLAAACGGNQPAEPQPAAPSGNASDGAASPRPAATLPLPGEESGALPEGHPPIGEGSSIPTPPAPSRATALHWDTPASWVEEQPASSMRIAQYRVPGPGGDAECIVYYFGPGQGGSPHDNAVRWAGQFEQPDGGSSVERMDFRELEGAPMPVMIVEVTGTYDGGMTMTAAPAEKKPDYMLLGGIAQGPDAPWFWKLTGPRKTVEAQRKPFEQMLRGLHAAH